MRDLYQVVAKVLQLPSEDPQKLLLLAEYDSRQTLTMHTQGSEPLSTVQISNGPGHFSSSKPLLLAYHYASPEQGPASGKQLLVYHRYLFVVVHVPVVWCTSIAHQSCRHWFVMMGTPILQHWFVMMGAPQVASGVLSAVIGNACSMLNGLCVSCPHPLASSSRAKAYPHLAAGPPFPCLRSLHVLVLHKRLVNVNVRRA